MHMADWIAKLDDFLRLSDRDVLGHAGRASAEMTRLKGSGEYERWHERAVNAPAAVEARFVEVIGATKVIEASRPKRQHGPSKRATV